LSEHIEEQKFPLPQTLRIVKKNQIVDNKKQPLQADEQTFARVSSIPPVHMPASEVHRSKRTGFVGQSLPRYTVVHDQHDLFKLSCRNHIG